MTFCPYRLAFSDRTDCSGQIKRFRWLLKFPPSGQKCGIGTYDLDLFLLSWCDIRGDGDQKVLVGMQLCIELKPPGICNKSSITINGGCSLYVPLKSKFEAAVFITRAVEGGIYSWSLSLFWAPKQGHINYTPIGNFLCKSAILPVLGPKIALVKWFKGPKHKQSNSRVQNHILLCWLALSAVWRRFLK